MNDDIVGLGTDLKLNLSIAPIHGITMDDYSWLAEIYTSAKRNVIIEKNEAIRIDENNYVLCVDTSILGTGAVKCKVTAYIPDADFDDNHRTEVSFINTGVSIVKSI